jgi:hypothetical protein
MRERPFTVFVRHRPIRTGFLIDTGVYGHGTARFEELVDAIVRHNYFLWGGRINPIVFYSGDSLTSDDWKQLEAVDVDCVKTFSPIPKKLVKQLDERLQPWSIEEAQPAQPNAPLHVESYGVVTPPTPDNLRAFGDAKFVLFDFAPECEELIQRFVHRNFGTYWQFFEPRTNNVRREGWLEKLMPKINVERIHIADRAALANALILLAGTPPGGKEHKAPLRFIAPALLPSVQLGETWPQTTNVYQVIVGNAPSDFAEFWNGVLWRRTWSAPYAYQMWLPTELANDPLLTDALRNWLRLFTGVGNSNAKNVEFLSTSILDAELDALRQRICAVGAWSPRGHVAQPDVLAARKRKAEEDFFSIRRGLVLTNTENAARYSGSHDEETFSLVAPEIMEEGINPDGVWMADVQIELMSPDWPTAAEQSWWCVPRLNSGGLLFSMFREAARVNRYGLFSVRMENQSGPYSRRVKPELRINLPKRAEVVRALITHPRNQPIFTKDMRYEDRHQPILIDRVRISDKGEYLRGLIQVFGSFWTAKRFCERRLWRHMFAKLANYDARRDAGLRRDIANLLRKQESAARDPERMAGRVLGLVRGRGRGGIALPYSAFKHELDELARIPTASELNYPEGDTVVCRFGIQHLTEEEMNQGLNELIEINVLRPGAYVRCSYCGIRSWYHVDDLRQEVDCAGCGHKQSIGVQQEWCYSLNTLAEMSVLQGQLAAMQAVAALASHSHNSFFFCPSLDLFKTGSLDVWHEVDVLGVSEGDFVVGEVKGGERNVVKQDFEELAEIVEALRAQRAIMFLPQENITADTVAWLQDTKARLLPLGAKAEIYALPTI